MLCILLAGLMVAATYPGWLHPQRAAAYQTRLDWSLEPEAGLERAAKRMQEFHAAGLVPGGQAGWASARSSPTTSPGTPPELRCFVNSRYPFHRNELPDLLAARLILNSRKSDPATPNEGLLKLKELNRVATERDADYLVVASTAGRRTDSLSLLQLINDSGWVLWYLDGRLTVLGRLTGDAAHDEAVRARQIDTARLAFGPGLPRLPEAVPLPPSPRAVELAEQYIDRPRPVPPEADDTAVYGVYANYVRQVLDARYTQSVSLQQQARMALLGGGRATAFATRPLEDEALAPAGADDPRARQAIAANPDAAEPYAALAEAYAMPGAPRAGHAVLWRTQRAAGASRHGAVPIAGTLSDPDRQRCRPADHPEHGARPDGVFRGDTPNRRGATGLQPVRWLLRQPARAGAARVGCVDYTRRRQAGGRSEGSPRRDGEPPGWPQPAAVQRAREAISRVTDPLAQFNGASESGLPLLAIELFNALPADGTSKIPPEVALAKIALESRACRLAEAAGDLAALNATLEQLARRGPADQLGIGFRKMQVIAARMSGNPGADAAAMPRPELPRVQYDPTVLRLPAVVAGLQGLGGGTLASLLNEQPPDTPLVRHLNQMVQAREILLADSIATHDLALLALRDGNTADARKWFREALAPQGVKLADLGDSDRAARIEQYITLIDRAQTPAPY